MQGMCRTENAGFRVQGSEVSIGCAEHNFNSIEKWICVGFSCGISRIQVSILTAMYTLNSELILRCMRFLN